MKQSMKENTVPLRESKRIGIWIRVSTEDQVRGESPETHERRARLYAEAKGWTEAEVYRLDAVSGKTVKEHPEAKRMLEAKLDVMKQEISNEPAFNWSDEPVAVNPHDRLARMASDRGWAVEDWG